MSLVEVENVRVELNHSGSDIVDDISFTIESGEVLALVGESGCGKTTIGLALLGDARSGTSITKGSIRIAETNVLKLSPEQLQDFRGTVVSFVPQNPGAALNPALRVGKQLSEILEFHMKAPSRDLIARRIRDILTEVNLPSDESFLRRFPHQLSGGQQQRLCLAAAFIMEPSLLILDEPTTGLDVATQARILETVRDLCSRHGVAALYITHDLAVVANIAQRVMVLYAGRLAEIGPRVSLLSNPAHPYTRKLVAAVPDIRRKHFYKPIPGTAPRPGSRPSGCYFSPRCWAAIPPCYDTDPPTVEVKSGHLARCLRVGESLQLAPPETTQSPGSRVHQQVLLTIENVSAHFGQSNVIQDVTAEIRRDECLAIVGESGSGKTTLARAIVGLHHGYRGTIEFEGQLLERRGRERTVETQRRIQYVFQNPYNSLNPRRRIAESLAMPIVRFFDVRGRLVREQVARALERVMLSPELAHRYPPELSGGELQRVAIARALVCKPSLMICDEVTSALDVSVQAAIIELLGRLRSEEGLSLLFITHNVALVRSISDRVLVMDNGRVVEQGDTDVVLDQPSAPHTRTLLEHAPSFANGTNQPSHHF